MTGSLVAGASTATPSLPTAAASGPGPIIGPGTLGTIADLQAMPGVKSITYFIDTGWDTPIDQDWVQDTGVGDITGSGTFHAAFTLTRPSDDPYEDQVFVVQVLEDYVQNEFGEILSRDYIDPGESLTFTRRIVEKYEYPDGPQGPRVTLISQRTSFYVVRYDPRFEDTIPPTAPIITTTGKTDTTVDLLVSGGTDNVGIVSYKIFRNGDLVFIATPGETYKDMGLLPGTEYTYTARAGDLAGNESPDSAELVVTTTSPDTGTPPGTPPGMTEEFDSNIPTYITDLFRRVVVLMPLDFQQGVADGLETVYRVIANIPVISNAFAIVNALTTVGDIEIAIIERDEEKLEDARYNLYWSVVSAIPVVGNVTGIADGAIDYVADITNWGWLDDAKETAERRAVDTWISVNPAGWAVRDLIDGQIIPGFKSRYGWI